MIETPTQHANSPLADFFEVPVALFVFNRPKVTQLIFEAVSRIRPRRLFLIADGPRADRPGEAEACAEVRRIVTAVDWPCEVATDFSPSNVGCGRRMSSGIDWVFNNVDDAIFIEDDCLASPQFFDFCRAMLDHYRYDTRIGTIAGTNCMIRHADFPGSYFFSRCPHIWGWASWRRSWALYDYGMSTLAAAREARLLENVMGTERLAACWYNIFGRVESGELDTWDFQLFFTSFCNSWLHIIPATNLVSNIGYGPDATHCREPTEFADLPLGNLLLPLRHPDFVVRCLKHDEFDEQRFLNFGPPPSSTTAPPEPAIAPTPPAAPGCSEFRSSPKNFVHRVFQAVARGR